MSWKGEGERRRDRVDTTDVLDIVAANLFSSQKAAWHGVTVSRRGHFLLFPLPGETHKQHTRNCIKTGPIRGVRYSFQRYRSLAWSVITRGNPAVEGLGLLSSSKPKIPVRVVLGSLLSDLGSYSGAVENTLAVAKKRWHRQLGLAPKGSRKDLSSMLASIRHRQARRDENKKCQTILLHGSVSVTAFIHTHGQVRRDVQVYLGFKVITAMQRRARAKYVLTLGWIRSKDSSRLSHKCPRCHNAVEMPASAPRRPMADT
jgi:hypothetical protein